MELNPKGPPGRVTRKARAYHSEIRRLREAGYTLNSIRQALADVGIEVSVSAVRREALHKGVPSGLVEPAGTPAVGTRATPTSVNSTGYLGVPSLLKGSFVNDSRTGKQIVDEFMKGRTTNPLLQERT